MRLLGAESDPMTSGRGTFEGRDEHALRDW